MINKYEYVAGLVKRQLLIVHTHAFMIIQQGLKNVNSKRHYQIIE